MKKLILIALLVSFSNNFSQANACVQFHKIHCYKDVDGDWIYNSQSKSALYEEGLISKLSIVVYNGFDYRISVCDEGTFEKPPVYQIFDSRTGDLIADSKTLPTKEFIFKSTNSQKLVIEVEVPKGKTKSSGKGCVGLLILQRVTGQP